MYRFAFCYLTFLSKYNSSNILKPKYSLLSINFLLMIRESGQMPKLKPHTKISTLLYHCLSIIGSIFILGTWLVINWCFELHIVACPTTVYKLSAIVFNQSA